MWPPAMSVAIPVDWLDGVLKFRTLGNGLESGGFPMLVPQSMVAFVGMSWDIGGRTWLCHLGHKATVDLSVLDHAPH